MISEKETGARPLYETNLESWYQLLVILTTERVCPNYSIGSKQAQITTKFALDHLLLRLKQVPPKSIRSRISDVKLKMLLISISLRCITVWQEKCVGDHNLAEDLKNKLVESMQEIGQSYGGYGKSLRPILIGLILNWVEIVKEPLEKDETILEYLLGHACSLALSDIEELREAVRKRDRKRKLENDMETECREEAEETVAECECIPSTLAICLVTRLVRFKVETMRSSGRKSKSPSLQLRQLMPELLTTVGITLQKHPYMKFSKAALTLLSVIARSFYETMPVNDEAIAKLWLALVPPKNLKNSLLESLYKVNILLSVELHKIFFN